MGKNEVVEILNGIEGSCLKQCMCFKEIMQGIDVIEKCNNAVKLGCVRNPLKLGMEIACAASKIKNNFKNKKELTTSNFELNNRLKEIFDSEYADTSFLMNDSLNNGMKIVNNLEYYKYKLVMGVKKQEHLASLMDYNRKLLSKTAGFVAEMGDIAVNQAKILKKYSAEESNVQKSRLNALMIKNSEEMGRIIQETRDSLVEPLNSTLNEKKEIISEMKKIFR